MKLLNSSAEGENRQLYNVKSVTLTSVQKEAKNIKRNLMCATTTNGLLDWGC